jgi:serine/threonine-protein kinase RsbW
MWSRSQEAEAMNIWWTLHLRREAASVPLARKILLGTMDSVGVDPQVSFDIGVALTEACANVVEHAVAGSSDEFQVTVTLDEERCGVEVIDFGPGFAGVGVGSDAGAGCDEQTEDPDTAVAEGDDQDWFLSDTAALFSGTPLDVPWGMSGEAGHGRSRSFTALAEDTWQDGPDLKDTPGDPEALALLPGDPAAESGRGLFLIRSLVDHVQFRNHPCRGAVVSFDKALRWQNGSNTLLTAS